MVRCPDNLDYKLSVAGYDGAPSPTPAKNPIPQHHVPCPRAVLGRYQSTMGRTNSARPLAGRPNLGAHIVQLSMEDRLRFDKKSRGIAKPEFGPPPTVEC
jgi:hypothetical protein